VLVEGELSYFGAIVAAVVFTVLAAFCFYVFMKRRMTRTNAYGVAQYKGVLDYVVSNFLIVATNLGMIGFGLLAGLLWLGVAGGPAQWGQ